MSDNDEIATVTRGDWGDTWPSLKIEGDSFSQRAVPFIDKITYGHIPDDQATANANLIAAAPELLEQLERVVEWFDDRSDYLDVSPIRSAIAKAHGTDRRLTPSDT
jgi:hypothetical protein